MKPASPTTTNASSMRPVALLALMVVGLAFWWPALRSTSFRYYLNFGDVAYAGMPVFLLASLAAIAALMLVRPIPLPRRVVGGTALVVGGATVLAGLLSSWGVPFAPHLRAACFALYSVAMPLLWLSAIAGANVPSRRLLLILTGSFALSYAPSQIAFVVPCFSLLNPMFGPVLSAALLAGFLALSPHGDDSSHLQADGENIGSAAPLTADRYLPIAVPPRLPKASLGLPFVPFAIFVCLICSLIFGLFQFSYTVGDNLVASNFSILNTLFLVLALALLGVAAVSRDTKSAQFFIVLVCAATFFMGNIVLPAAGQNTGMLNTSMLGPCRSLFCSLLFCFIAVRVVEAGVRPSTVEGSRAVRGASAVFCCAMLACNVLWGLAVPFTVGVVGLQPSAESDIVSLLFGLTMGICVIAFLILTVRTLLASREGRGEGDQVGRLAREHGLTERERETLELILAGHTFQRIADVQGISLGGIQGRAKSIYRKLGVHSRQELVDMAEVKEPAEEA